MYNLEKLIRIHAFDKTESYWYYFQPKIVWFGIEIRKEGIRERLNPNIIQIKDIPNHFIIDGIVYEKPEVVLTFQGNIKLRLYFDTIKEANEKMEGIVNCGNKWIR
jgi:hypothetical protein